MESRQINIRRCFLMLIVCGVGVRSIPQDDFKAITTVPETTTPMLSTTTFQILSAIPTDGMSVLEHVTGAAFASESVHVYVEPTVDTEVFIAGPRFQTTTVLPAVPQSWKDFDTTSSIYMHSSLQERGDDAFESFLDAVEFDLGTTENTSSLVIPTLPSNAFPSFGLQHHQVISLLEILFDGYDLRIRPRNDQTLFVRIFSNFVPYSIIEFDTRVQNFSILGYFKMDWRDDFLTWDPSDYENATTVRIPAQSVWIPKLTVDKAHNGKGLVGDRQTDVVLINYMGYVRWFPEDIYSVVCNVTIKFFPFDVQTCMLTYYIADEDNSTINLKHVGEADTSEYMENAEWKLVNLTVEEMQRGDIQMISLKFKVERRGGFTLFTLIVPVLMLSTLSGATFLIPIESGEKCSFSVTIFLAYGIFETIVIDTLPHNSLEVSYFIIFLTSMLIVSTMLTFYTILQAKVFSVLGNQEFRLFRCLHRMNNKVITWGAFLKKLDTYIFVLFLALVICSTVLFFTVMTKKSDYL